MVVASAAIVSFFKLEGAPLLEEAAEYESVLLFLPYMIIYALVFEFTITTLRNLKNVSTLIAHEQRTKWIFRALSFGYALQVLAHIFFIVGLFSYASGYVDGFMSLRHPHA